MLLMACGGSDSPTGPGTGGALTEAALIGKWNITTTHYTGWQNDSAGNKKTVDSTDTFPSGINTAEYKSDKSFIQSLGGFGFNGTWSIKGDSLITISTFFGITDTTSAYVVINGNSGTYTTHQVDSEQDLVVTSSATKQ